MKVKEIIFTPSGQNLHRFFKDIRKYDPLSKEEQHELLLRYRVDGEREALEKLILHNVRYIISLAKRYQNSKVSLSDLVSEGILGLIEGIDKFDITRTDIKLFSYCTFWIRKKSVSCALNQSVVRSPENRITARGVVKKASDQIFSTTEQEATPEDIYDHLGGKLSIENIEKAQFELENRFYDHENIEDHMSSGNEEKDNFFWSDCEIILADGRDSFIVKNNFGIDCDPMTIEKIAEELHLTEEEVQERLSKALLKLKDHL